MYVHIHFEWKTNYHPIGWSLGYCDPCQHEGPVRLEKVVEVLYLNGLIPLRKRDKGRVARCDFCRRLLTGSVRNWYGIALADWSPQDGVAVLCKKLGGSTPVVLANVFTDARLHSLLSALQQASSLTRIGVGPIGILAGCIVGVSLAVPLANWLHQNQQAPARIDELGFTLLLCVISLIPGAIIGALIEAWLRRERRVAARIREAYDNYPFDLYRMEQLSQDYGRNVQRAVKALIDEVPRRW
jgi:hypothetical protein